MPALSGSDSSPFIAVAGSVTNPEFAQVTQILKLVFSAGAGTTTITMADGTIYVLNSDYQSVVARIIAAWPG